MEKTLTESGFVGNKTLIVNCNPQFFARITSWQKWKRISQQDFK